MQNLPRILRHANGQAFCTTEYVADEHWLRTTWQGFVSPLEAERGAQVILEPLSMLPVHYLLNDNSQLQGPWFDSIDWLQRVWAPQAARLGLRYVAHVLQPHTEADLSTLLATHPFEGQFELQLFSTVEGAAAWLHDCQRHDELAASAARRPPGAAAADESAAA